MGQQKQLIATVLLLVMATGLVLSLAAPALAQPVEPPPGPVDPYVPPPEDHDPIPDHGPDPTNPQDEPDPSDPCFHDFSPFWEDTGEDINMEEGVPLYTPSSLNNPLVPKLVLPADSNVEGERPKEWYDNSWWPWNWPKSVAGKVADWVVGGVHSLLLNGLRKGMASVTRIMGSFMFGQIIFDPAGESSPLRHVYNATWAATLALLILIIVAAAFRGFFRGLSGGSWHKLKGVMARALVAVVLAAFAYLPFQWLADLTTAFSWHMLTLGAQEASPAQAMANALLLSEGSAPGLFTIIVAYVLLLFFFLLALFYIFRFFALQFMIVMAPIFFGLTVDDTGMRYCMSYVKVMAGLILIEAIHACLLAVFTSLVKGSPSFMVNLSYTAVLIILMFWLPVRLMKEARVGGMGGLNLVRAAAVVT